VAEAAKKAVRAYTFSDWLQWSDDKRWEIIGGDAYDMSPPPAPRHQIIAAELFVQLFAFFKGKRCRVLPAPVGVKLSEEDIVQPDLIVVCKEKQIKSSHIEGPPSLVVEIISPSSTVHDRVRKTSLYAHAGVKEFWLVTPWPSLVEVLWLRHGSYIIRHVFEKDQILTSATFPGLRVKLKPVFDFPLEPNEFPRLVKESPAPYGSRATRARPRRR
jgi:Uma2 family endonuclease